MAQYLHVKGKRLNHDEIASLVRRELDVAQGYDADILADKRARALDYYQAGSSMGHWPNTRSKQLKVPDAPPGRSNTHSTDVADTVHAVHSQIQEMIVGSTMEFPADSQEDEAQAQLETDFVQAVIKQNDLYKIFHESSFDALLQGNGWIQVEPVWEDAIVNERYENVSDDDLARATEQRLPGETVSISNLTETDDGNSFDIRRVTPRQRLTVEALPPENVVFSPSSGQYDIQTTRFVARRKLYTVAELINFGMSRQDAIELPSHRDDHWPGIIARDQAYYESSDNELGGKQDATTLKECFHCWMLLDVEDNGQWERFHILIGGYESKIIIFEPAPFVPITTGSPIPMPHRIQGQGLYEVMGEIQDSKTILLRNMLDNAIVANGSRTAVNVKRVNMNDLTDGRVNGVVRVNGLPGEHLMGLPATEIIGQTVTALEYLDEVRSSRGAAALDLNSAELQLGETSATSANKQFEAKERMSGWYCANLINTLVANTYLLIHETLRTYFDQPMDAKIKGRWVQTNPATWSERTNVACTVGLTPTEKALKKADLAGIMQQQVAMLQQGGGGIITDQNKLYNAAADMVKAMGVGNPHEYWIDPSSPEAEQARQQQAQQQAQMEEQLRMANDRMQYLQLQIENQKIDIDKYKHDTELRFKYWKESGDNQTDITTTRIQADAQRDAARSNGEGDKAN